MIKHFVKSLVPRSVWLRLSGIRAQAEALIFRGGTNAVIEFLISPLLIWISMNLAGRANWVRRLKLRGYRFPIYYRVGTSDLDVIWQILIRCEYECVAHEKSVSLIIDCGANIGCTSFYFLHHYPEARVVAVEPDSGNCKMCRRNLKVFGDRFVLVHSAVWPTATPLRVARGSYRDGREWSFQVEPVSDGGTSELLGTTISDLIDASGCEQVDLLKIDIEDAEIHLFSKKTEDWLPRYAFPFVIELHGRLIVSGFFLNPWLNISQSLKGRES